jgi:hypothetical protein
MSSENANLNLKIEFKIDNFIAYDVGHKTEVQKYKTIFLMQMLRMLASLALRSHVVSF